MTLPQVLAPAKRLLRTSRGVRDVSVSILPQAANSAVGFATSIALARGLGAAGMGTYSLVISISTALITLSDLGIGQTAVRFASHAVALGNKAVQYAVLRRALRWRLATAALVCLAAFLAAPYIAERIWHTPELTHLIRLSIPTAIFAALAAAPIIYFQSMKQFARNAAVQCMQTLINFAGILLLAWYKKWSVETIILVSIVSSAIGAAVFLGLVPRETLWVSRRKRSEWHADIKQLHPRDERLDNTSMEAFAACMVASSILVTLILRADLWLMGIYLPADQIGHYTVAQKFSMPLMIILGALNTVLWPRASGVVAQQEAFALLRRTLKMSLLAALALLPYAFLVPFTAPYVFGTEYTGSIALGQVLCFRCLLSLIAAPLGAVSYSFGMVRFYPLMNLVQLAMVVGLNILLLPTWGPMGAAIALLANDTLGLIVIASLMGYKAYAARGGGPPCSAVAP
jgi:O-antigen/teichoic acid export membrane protein